jgi:toxin FitB
MRGYLIDTNVISEWTKPRPSARVVDFVSGSRKRQLFACSVCFAEIRRGAQLARTTDARNRLLSWLENDLRAFFDGRVLEVTEDVVLAALDVMNSLARKRQSVHFADSLIAAVAHVHQLTVVSRNAKDFTALNVPVFNPWTGERFNGA